MAEAKHSFVDDYPYLVYTAKQDTLVYSDKADTSIDDISSGGEEYNIKCYTLDGEILTEDEDHVTIGNYDTENHLWVPGETTVNKAEAGITLAMESTYKYAVVLSEPDANAIYYPDDKGGIAFTMPKHDVCVVISGL